MIPTLKTSSSPALPSPSPAASPSPSPSPPPRGRETVAAAPSGPGTSIAWLEGGLAALTLDAAPTLGAAPASAVPSLAGPVAAAGPRAPWPPPPPPETMATIFVPGGLAGESRGADYPDYLAGYRRRLGGLLSARRLSPALLAGPRLGGQAPGQALAGFHAVGLRLGQQLAARSGSWAHGAFGKMHTVLVGTELMALKIMRGRPAAKAGATEPVTLADAQREAALLARYVCPQARLFVDPQTEKYGIGMDLLLGSISDLQRPKEASAVAELRSVRILRDVLGQLVRMHADGVWHLDIKPDNLMVFDDGRIGAVDLGMARFADELPSVGTMPYWPPEAMAGDMSPAHGGARDVWSLGLTVLEQMLPADTNPFDPALGFRLFGTMQAYLAWYRARAPEGRFSMAHLLTVDVEPVFDAAFRQLHAGSALLCGLLLEALLTPLPVRATAEEALRLCRLRLPDCPEQAARWRARVDQWRAPRRFRQAQRLALRLRLHDEAPRARASAQPPPEQDAVVG